MTIFCIKRAIVEQCIAIFSRKCDIDVFCDSEIGKPVDFTRLMIALLTMLTEKEPITWSLGNRLLLCALRAPWWACCGGCAVAGAQRQPQRWERISPRRSLARDHSKHPDRARGSRRQVDSVGLHQCTGHRMPAQTSRPGYQGSTSHLRRNP